MAWPPGPSVSRFLTDPVSVPDPGGSEPSSTFVPVLDLLIWDACPKLCLYPLLSPPDLVTLPLRGSDLLIAAPWDLISRPFSNGI